MEVWIIWLILSVVLVIIELMTQWISTLCFAVGCFAALIVSLFGCTLSVQLIMLAVFALLTFITLGDKFVRYHQRRAEANSELSNVDAMKHRHATVVEAIDAGETGRVKLDGDNWQARTEDGAAVAVGETVEVLGNDSIVLIVRKL